MRLTAGLFCVVLVLTGVQSAEASRLEEGCAAPTDTPTLSVGVVGCQAIASAAMGGLTQFSYWIPTGCNPALGRECPVLYYLHGTSRTHTSGVGVNGSDGSKLVKALTSGPPIDPRTDPEPWRFADPSTWVPKPAIDMIIVSPHNPTVPGGYGPVPDVDTGWADWNPRYARDGDSPRYDTPAPRISTFLAKELAPYVDAHFPTRAHRTFRAITGKSQGGFGAFANGFAHPDIWSSQSMLSGGGFPFPGLVLEALDDPSPVGVAPPGAVPHSRLPGVVPSVVPDALMGTFVVALLTVGFGDAVADNAYWRMASPHDLAANIRAWSADGVQSTHLQYNINDTIPRRIPDDFLDSFYAGSQAFESILFPTNLYLERLLDAMGIERTFRVGPGLHEDPYQAPYHREILEGHWNNLAHPDGGGGPRPDPVVFDYRSIHPSFEAWGWRFEIERAATEFLYLTDVSCAGLTMRGTGRVKFASPCDGVERAVDLGPSQPVDEPLGAGVWRGYGRTVHVDLQGG